MRQPSSEPRLLLRARLGNCELSARPTPRCAGPCLRRSVCTGGSIAGTETPVRLAFPRLPQTVLAGSLASDEGTHHMSPSTDAPYVLGDTSAEHERLIRRAAIFEPFTERLFRDAGVGPGQRVLDIGSGVGEVALLAVGPSGAVVGVERDPTTLATARSRVARAGLLANVSFMESDVRNVATGEPFDAVVGRVILQYLPDAGAVVRSLAALVRPGGRMVFQDVWPASLLHFATHLPLRTKCASLIYRTFERSGANMDMELVLYRAIQEAGLPAPKMRIEILVGDDPGIVRWVYDLLCTLLPRIPPDELAASGIGDLESLDSRLETERLAARSFGASVALVGAWSRKPG
jgi:ubiquinone/menaquinone biosynthesis C-methylase UbiE